MAIPSSPEGWEIEVVGGYLNSMSQAKLTGFYYRKKRQKGSKDRKKKNS